MNTVPGRATEILARPGVERAGLLEFAVSVSCRAATDPAARPNRA